MKTIIALIFTLLLTAHSYAAETVNINTADAATLATNLNGIGLSKAEAIVEYRKEHGPFKSADQLANVQGIGLKTVEKNKDLITVGSSTTTKTTAANTTAVSKG